MQKEIRAKLKQSIKAFMLSNGLNWGNIQTPTFKKDFECPTGCRTLWKIVKDPKYKTMHVNKQSELLTFFKIEHKQSYGIINIIEHEES